MTRPAPRPAVLVDSTLAALHIELAYGVAISPDRIRQWGRRGYLTRQPHGDARYDLAEVVAHARARGLLDAPACAESCA